MELNADRLAKLAGLSVAKRTSLNEASNRSQHEEPGHDPEFRHGKGQLAEGDGEKEVEETHCNEEEEQEEAMMYEDEDASEGYGHMMDEKLDDDLDLVEIDEAMLAEEIARMRQERLQENELRSIIRNEVASVVNQMKKSRAENSQRRSVEATGATKGFTGPKGFPGPGFM